MEIRARLDCSISRYAGYLESSTRQKNVRQKNESLIFLSYIFLSSRLIFFEGVAIAGRGGLAMPSPIKKLVCGGWL
jgi:hypothetical protein